jgi:hypothetical protein
VTRGAIMSFPRRRESRGILMTINEALEIIGFPDSGRIDKKIFKKAIYENAGLVKKQIEVIKNEISDIRWLYVLKPGTINIPVLKNEDFDYEEIQIIGVSLKDDKKKDTVAGIIQKCIPYPVILLIEHDDNLAVSVASKRINKGDSAKSVIDEEYLAGWISSEAGHLFIESLKPEKLSFKNLYEFYEDVIDRAKLFLVCEYKEAFAYENKKATARLFSAYQKVKELEESKRQLQRQIKKETDFAKKVKMNVDIKKFEIKIKKFMVSI